MPRYDTAPGGGEESTRDLLEYRAALPGEPTTAAEHDDDKQALAAREKHNRRYGRTFGQAGALVVALTLIGVALTPEQVAATFPRAVTAAVINAFLLAGFGGLLVWVMERLTRYNRTLARRVLAGQEVLSASLGRLESALESTTQAQAAAVRQLTAAVEDMAVRVEKMEDVVGKMPDYSSTIMEGIKIGSRGVVPHPDDGT